jgi:hypothetical protein
MLKNIRHLEIHGCLGISSNFDSELLQRLTHLTLEDSVLPMSTIELPCLSYLQLYNCKSPDGTLHLVKGLQDSMPSPIHKVIIGGNCSRYQRL